MENNQSIFDYDLLVIGGGSGGIASAKRAAQLYNAKVGGKSHVQENWPVSHSHKFYMMVFK